MSEMTGLAPILAERALRRSLAVHREAPGNGYALISRARVSIALTETSDSAALRASANTVRAHIYGGNLRGLSALPEGRMRAPCRQHSGNSEPHMKGPDGSLVSFSADPRPETATQRPAGAPDKE